ncbi:MAG: transglutaminase domain-containing protein [Planctomycetota bacterium]
MQRLLSFARTLLLPLLLATPAAGLARDVEKLFYGFEMNGTLVGYVEATETSPAVAGEPRIVETKTFAKLTLLGQDFDLRVQEIHRLDATTGRVLSHETTTETGSMVVGITVVVEGDEARITPRGGGTARKTALDEGVILDDSIHFPYVLRDLAGAGASKTYRVLDYNDGTIHDVTYTGSGDETLLLEGEEHPCRRFAVRDAQIGLAADLWIDAAGRLFRADLPQGVVIRRASPAVVGQIQRAELDETLLARVDTAIADFQGITYMKVRGKLRTAGEVVTPESLNAPGQAFIGTVTGDLVEGVFEIRPARYDGAGAPPFPPPIGADPALAESLSPEMLIESDDPVLVAFATERTAGAADAWEAVCRLSRWVADEITYEIPGSSARGTFDARKGECGSHSRLLVALCRGVGIPARLACGAMYAPTYGGAFGQHAWTEVYMGEAGWIPVDSTAREVDYVDAGHLRLGTKASFFPEEMEILDYAGRSTAGGTATRMGSFARSPWEVGKTYTYRYAMAGLPIGTDSFTVESREERADGTLVITCRTKLAITGLETGGTFQVDGRGRPLSFHLTGKAAALEYRLDCEFAAGEVVEKVVKAGQPIERTVELPEEVYLLDNNHFGGYALLLAAVPRTAGAVLSFRIFHPSTTQLLPMQITVGGKEAIEVGGETIECTVCDLVLAGTPLKVWLDAEGRIRRETEASGRLVVELQR